MEYSELIIYRSGCCMFFASLSIISTIPLSSGGFPFSLPFRVFRSFFHFLLGSGSSHGFIVSRGPLGFPFGVRGVSRKPWGVPVTLTKVLFLWALRVVEFCRPPYRGHHGCLPHCVLFPSPHGIECARPKFITPPHNRDLSYAALCALT